VRHEVSVNDGMLSLKLGNRRLCLCRDKPISAGGDDGRLIGSLRRPPVPCPEIETVTNRPDCSHQSPLQQQATILAIYGSAPKLGAGDLGNLGGNSDFLPTQTRELAAGKAEGALCRVEGRLNDGRAHYLRLHVRLCLTLSLADISMRVELIRPGDRPVLVADATRARTELGFAKTPVGLANYHSHGECARHSRVANRSNQIGEDDPLNRANYDEDVQNPL
jgi:hypothetical protein